MRVVNRKNTNVIIAEKHSPQSTYTASDHKNSVVTLAERKAEESRELMILTDNVLNADEYSDAISIQVPKGATLAEIASVEDAGYEDVYNMEVETDHNFAVNGGYIVHNCMDAVRYMMYTVVRREARYE